MSARQRRIFWAAIIITAVAALVEACGPEITFRAYLDKKLWRPTIRYIATLADRLPAENKNYAPYAGMPGPAGAPALQTLRDAYANLFDTTPDGNLEWPQTTIDHLNDLLRAVRPANPAETNELDLLRCKILLRAAQPSDAPSVALAANCFADFLKTTHPPALESEARGWLARTYFLQNQRPQAAKLYLDELAVTSSNIQRSRLLTSLDMLYPDTDDHRLNYLKADMNEYFDTPAHALFIADRVTNSSFPLDVYRQLMTQLESHKDLFRQDEQSNALALELMRASTRAGDPKKTLEYAALIPPGSVARNDAEFDWLSAVANYELHNDDAAETLLKRVLDSASADRGQKTFAASALIGVYHRTQQPIEELHAAFAAGAPRSGSTLSNDSDVDLANLDGWDFDVAYLLDVQLTDAELQEYEKRYPDPEFGRLPTEDNRTRPAVELVRYALAVRHARREEFAEAANLYRELGAFSRAKRMEEAEALHSAAQNLQGQYNYADFLVKNEDGIFFNDAVWHQFQTWAFMPKSDRRGFAIFNYRALSDAEAAKYREQERKFLDEQDEYWRAYQIFNRIVEQAGHTDLGRKAATRALFCLRRISLERFGRQAEIRAADVRLTNWLKK